MAIDLLTGDEGLADVVAFQRLWRGAVLTVTYEGLGITTRLVCLDRHQREMCADHKGVSLGGDAAILRGDLLNGREG